MSHYLWIAGAIAHQLGLRLGDLDTESIRSALLAARQGIPGELPICSQRGSRLAETIGVCGVGSYRLLPDQRSVVLEIDPEAEFDGIAWSGEARSTLFSELEVHGADQGWALQLLPESLASAQRAALGTIPVLVANGGHRRLVGILGVPGADSFQQYSRDMHDITAHAHGDSGPDVAKQPVSLSHGVTIAPTSDGLRWVATYRLVGRGSVRPHPISFGVIQRLAAERGIRAEIDRDAVMRLNRAMMDGRALEEVLAVGRTPIHGSSETIVALDESGSDSARRGLSLVFVAASVPFARVVRRQAPFDGCDIFGNVLSARLLDEPALLMPETIERDAQGYLHSKQAGRVYFTAQNVTFDPVFEVQGDVNGRAGPQRFHEHTVIHGSVEDVTIHAEKGLIVTGTVRNAVIIGREDVEIQEGVTGGSHIRARGKISVKFAESSRLLAGGDMMVARAAFHCVIGCDGMFQNTADDGGIFGGILIAAQGANVAALGSKGAKATMVHIGRGYRSLLVEQMMRGRLKKLTHAAQLVGEREPASAKPASKKSRRMSGLLEQQQERRDRIHRIQEMLRSRLDRILLDDAAPATLLGALQITVRGVLSSQAEVFIGEHSTVASQGGVQGVIIEARPGQRPHLRSLQEKGDDSDKDAA